ncbi:WhiB family transcriptional regulator [Streptomyces sp. NPDC056485]|uniref:WhiB family transcriptional regulator n=1 Tax=Streptomyces sp. NPDC056485 TaxID=3345834 RepID=UPI0036BBB674
MTTSLYAHRAPDTIARAEDWRDDALCRRTAKVDKEGFFPVGVGPVALAAIEQAKGFCGLCPVRMACAQWALSQGLEHGIWGGLDEVQRRRLRRRHTAGELADPERLEEIVTDEWKARAEDALVEAYLTRTAQEEDGHVRWLTKGGVTVHGRKLTPVQLAFEVGHGRHPQGVVKAQCSRKACVAAEHLTDDRIRWEYKKRLQAAR